MNKLGKQTVLAAAAMLAGVGALTSTAAVADLTIVSKVDVTGLPTPPGGPQGAQGAPGGQPGGPPQGGQGRPGGGPSRYPQIITTYIKGTNVRTEVKDGAIRIYNGERKRITVINPTDKTYWTEDTEDSSGRFPFGRLNVDSTVAVKQADTASKENSALVAGAKTQKYGIAGNLQISIQRNDDENGAPDAGQNAAPAAPPNGDGAGQDQGRRGRGRGFMPTGPIKVAGELWVSNDLKAPDGKFLQDALYSPIVTIGRFRMLTAPIVEQLRTLPGLPLKSKVTVSVTMRDKPVAVTTTFAVQSIKTGDLDDALFERPSDYEHIDAPTFGRGGRRGQGGGDQGGPGNGPPPPSDN
ncbi:MAG: hypothetical protein P4L33_17635 [Capsulimonadaceae bacterium]|nr:hypothetical protein [Capsulimonadaceae bacterium]